MSKRELRLSIMSKAMYVVIGRGVTDCKVCVPNYCVLLFNRGVLEGPREENA